MICTYCKGTKWYTDIDGINERCPHCGGTGECIEYTKIKRDIEELRQERREIDKLLKRLVENEEARILLYSIGQTNPAMEWAKSVDGKYLYANKALAEHLFYGDENDLIGKDDFEVADIVRQTYPSHNFGSALCLNSDADCLEKNRPMKYFEFGCVRDSYRFVVAWKSPFYDKDGKVLGTCGVARYVDEEVLFLQDLLTTTSCEITRTKVKSYLEKYMFADSEPVADEYESKLPPDAEKIMEAFRATWFDREYK